MYFRLLFALALLGFIGVAQATIIRYTLDGVTFDDGGTITGFIDWDTSLPDLRDFKGSSQNYELTVSGGDTSFFPEYTYTHESEDIGTSGSIGTSDGPLRIIKFNASDTTPDRVLNLIPDANAATLGEDLTVPLFISPLNSFEMEFNVFNTRDVVSGQLLGEVTFLDTDGDGIADDQDPFPNAITSLSDDGVTVSIIPPDASSSCALVSVDGALAYPSQKPDYLQNDPGGAVQLLLENCPSSPQIDVSVDFGSTIPKGANVYQVTTDGWSELPEATISGSQISFKTADNGALDTDSTAGKTTVTVTHASPPIIPPQPVPTIAIHWLVLLAGFMLLLGTRSLRV